MSKTLKKEELHKLGEFFPEFKLAKRQPRKSGHFYDLRQCECCGEETMVNINAQDNVCDWCRKNVLD